MAEFLDIGSLVEGVMVRFLPHASLSAALPKDTPTGIRSELREGEIAASSGAHRAACAMFRSTVEKVLRLNGYSKGNLKDRIDQAAEDRIVTPAHQHAAHEEIRDLGNEILHEEWRNVTKEEFLACWRWTQRIIEDFYEYRTRVESILAKQGRISVAPPADSAK